jgi:hypothetical protein
MLLVEAVCRTFQVSLLPISDIMSTQVRHFHQWNNPLLPCPSRRRDRSKFMVQHPIRAKARTLRPVSALLPLLQPTVISATAARPTTAVWRSAMVLMVFLSRLPMVWSNAADL